MPKPADKVRKIIESVPRRAEAVRSITVSVERYLNNHREHEEHYGQRLHERVMEFVFGKGGRIIDEKGRGSRTR